MKKLIHTLSLLGAFGAAALCVQAQPAPRIAVIDMAKVFDGHYETQDQIGKLKVDEQKAQDEIDQLRKEGNAMVAQYKDLDEQAKNPTITSEAKDKAVAAREDLGRQIQSKMADVQNLANTDKQNFQTRIQAFRTRMMSEISDVAVEVAKRRGATILIDKSGPSLLGIPTLVYSDPAYDITDEVSAEINKNRPAAMAPMTPVPSVPADNNTTVPKITVPGISTP